MLVAFEAIIDENVDLLVLRVEATVLTLALATTLLHFNDRAKLHCIFLGTPGTWHSGTTISLPSLQLTLPALCIGGQCTGFLGLAILAAVFAILTRTSFVC